MKTSIWKGGRSALLDTVRKRMAKTDRRWDASQNGESMDEGESGGGEPGNMEWTRMSSSCIDSVGFSEDGGLYIRFANGGLWRYAEATRRDYEDMVSSPSAGKWYAENIKGKMTGTRA